MYRNLKAEMARKSMTIRGLAHDTGIRYQTLAEKIRMGGSFSLKEAVKIKNAVCPTMPLEQLFEES